MTDIVFGPEYHKIETMFLRTGKGIVRPGEWTTPEFEYLADSPWDWREKVDGFNLRLHFDGERVTVNGRTDEADIPARLYADLAHRKQRGDILHPAMTLTDPVRWRSVFGDAPGTDVTLYGEAYGGYIRNGTQYRPDVAVLLFDARVVSPTGVWWLKYNALDDIAGKLGFEVVPGVDVPGVSSLNDAWAAIQEGLLRSNWDRAQIEGLVGRPRGVDLFTRDGSRIIAKIKLRDWADYLRVTAEAAMPAREAQ